MVLVSPNGHRHVLHRKRHLRAGDVTEAPEGCDEAWVAGDETGPEARQPRTFGERLEHRHIGEASSLPIGRLEHTWGRGAAIDLRVAFIGEQQEVEAPRQGEGARKIGAGRYGALRDWWRIKI